MIFIYLPRTCEGPLSLGPSNPPKEGPFTPIKTVVINGFQVGNGVYKKPPIRILMNDLEPETNIPL